MLPKGGDALWSVGADSPESVSSDSADTCTESTIPSKFQEAIKRNIFVMTDNEEGGSTKGPMECNRDELLDHTTEPTVNKVLQKLSSGVGHTTQTVLDFLLAWGGGMGPTISPVKLYSFDQDPDEEQSTRTWHDITKTPLPHAPNMKIYCLYGVGVDTERAFFYKRNPGEQGLFAVDNSSEGRNFQKAADPPFILDTSIEDPENGIVHGIKYSDGDGSVPLLSLGYMCAGPWRDHNSGLNPSGSEVIIREYKHRTEFAVEDPMRKGPNSSEHVDVLGNHDMLADFVKIVSGEDADSVTDNIISDIKGIVKRIGDHSDGGRPLRTSDGDERI
jgi:phospholipid:diacylglycerol acyltransferase